MQTGHRDLGWHGNEACLERYAAGRIVAKVR
jgi:hypothetical protein